MRSYSLTETHPAGVSILDTDENMLNRRFSYHPPKDCQGERYELIRDSANDFARTLLERCPRSDELSRAIDKLDEAVMLANAAIARNE